MEVPYLDVNFVVFFNSPEDEAPKKGVAAQQTAQADGGAEEGNELQREALASLQSLAPHVELVSVHHLTFCSAPTR